MHHSLCHSHYEISTDLLNRDVVYDAITLCLTFRINIIRYMKLVFTSISMIIDTVRLKELILAYYTRNQRLISITFNKKKHFRSFRYFLFVLVRVFFFICDCKYVYKINISTNFRYLQMLARLPNHNQMFFFSLSIAMYPLLFCT